MAEPSSSPPRTAGREPFFVSVAMLAYNHEKFIAQAIESVLMQKTSFEVELVIGEDESTDGTRAICQQYAEKYPGRIRLFLRNRNDPLRLNYPPTLFYNFAETVKACRGQYVAYLDGDDYWTDENKLSIQVACLEQHPEAVLCAHRYERLFQDTGKLTHDRFDAEFSGKEQITVTQQDFLEPAYLLSSFIVYRRAALDGFHLKQCGWDTGIWGHVLSNGGTGIILNRFMGVYRRHAGGIWSSLPQSTVHRHHHAQNTMLVANEGFKSACIKSAYLSGAVALSHDLVEETVKSIQGCQAHTLEVMAVAAQQGAARVPGWVRPVSGLLGAAQERLLRGQAEFFSLFCLPEPRGAKRFARLALMVLLLATAAPLLLLVLLFGLLQRQKDGPPISTTP